MEETTTQPTPKKRTDWQTPLSLFHLLEEALGAAFAVDAAANEVNHLVDRWYGPGGVESDALSIPVWASPAFCNPPYTRGIGTWLRKFQEQASLGGHIITLLPAKVETAWWFDEVTLAKADVLFLVGRVKFDSPPGEARHYPPMFPSAVVVYGPNTRGSVGWWDWRERGVRSGECTEGEADV